MVDASRLRIPIFIKFAVLSSLLIIAVTTSVSLYILQKQKEQFFEQLIQLGETLVRVAARDIPSKLLADEELSLHQLVNAIASNQQVSYALITDTDGNIVAHSNLQTERTRYNPPPDLTEYRQSEAVRISTFNDAGDASFLFQQPITMGGKELGSVMIAVSQQSISENVRSAKMGVITLTLVIIVLGVLISFGFSLYFSKPIFQLQNSVKALGRGDFEHRVDIRRHDEMGDLGDAFNLMIVGLKERQYCKASLELASEVQQTLLPQSPPRVNGLDIASRSVYCDETGGDYFDFPGMVDEDHSRVAVVIGDVTGHGIASALLMASARAFLRQRAALPGDIAGVVSDVNRQLTADVEASGRFMTLFYLTVDPQRGEICWVRAGHDPGLLYDPQTDAFEELKGPGMALGVDEDWAYQANLKSGLSEGHIILIFTDGIWEAHNEDGERFGKEPIYEVVRAYRNSGAEEIVERIFERLTRFRGESASFEDDVTLVLIKVTAAGEKRKA